MFVSLYSFIDASTGDYQEEGDFYQEEEENFDHYPNQGKLIFLQSAKLYQGKAHSPITLCFMIPSQVLFLQSFYFIY